jgi:hypothetical protein
MPSIEYRPDRPKPYRARYWGPDGRLHSRSFARKDDAERWLTSEEASKLRGAWVDPRGSRRRFDDWASEWWELWASEPRRSPAALEAAESHLRLHIRPYFGRRPLGTISAQVVQRWQNELERRASHNLTMACRCNRAEGRRRGGSCGFVRLSCCAPAARNGLEPRTEANCRHDIEEDERGRQAGQRGRPRCPGVTAAVLLAVVRRRASRVIETACSPPFLLQLADAADLELDRVLEGDEPHVRPQGLDQAAYSVDIGRQPARGPRRVLCRAPP